MKKDATNPSAATANAEKQLRTFVGKFGPEHQTLIRGARRTLRNWLPAAHELVYDNYNFFVIGYCSTVRPSDCIVSLAAGASGVGLSFPYCGTKLPDPHKLLLGAGNQNRFIRLPSVKTLLRPEVQALVAAAVDLAKTPLPPKGKGTLIIRSVSAKQRPRRKPAK